MAWRTRCQTRESLPPMPLRIAIQMDPIADIEIAGDSSFALLLEAQARGHELFYYTPQNLALNDGAVLARGAPVKVADKEGAHFELGERASSKISPSSMRSCCVRTRRSTWRTSPQRISLSASTQRRWWSTTRQRCAMHLKSCSCSIIRI